MIMTGDPIGPASATPARQLPLWRTFLVFLLPMMIANILQSLSGTLNGMFLGQLIGVEAMATASVFFPVMFFFMSFVIGLSTGATILIGQAFGRGDLAMVRHVAGPVILVVVLIGIVIGGVGAIFAEPLLRGLSTPENILPGAVEYARVLLLSMPLLFLFILATSILRGVGDSVTPLWALVYSTLVGLILTPALITGMFGLPKLGATSAAVAGAIATVAALLWLGWRMRAKKMAFAPNAELLAAIRFDVPMLTRVLRLGVPMGVQMVIMALAEVVLLGLANRHGSDVTAAYGATVQVLSYVQLPAMSIGLAASILSAQAIGGGSDVHRLDAIMRAAQMLNLVITGLGVGAVYLLSHTIVGLFITDHAVIVLTEHLIGIVLWSVVLYGASVCISGTMRGSGSVLAPTALMISAIVIVEVPVATVLSGAIGVDGIWWAYPACFAAMLLFQGGYYTLVWHRSRIRALV
jgi:putative MATE family efflux protein